MTAEDDIRRIYGQIFTFSPDERDFWFSRKEQVEREQITAIEKLMKDDGYEPLGGIEYNYTPDYSLMGGEGLTIDIWGWKVLADKKEKEVI